VRDYLYVSDAKIDMLFEQIPVPLVKKITADLTLNLKVLSVSLRGNPSATTRYAKLGVVERYLHEYLGVGPLDAPQRYMYGTLRMRWGPVGADGSTVFFGGADDTTVVGLGGSLRHVLGAAPLAAEPMRSAAPLLYRTLVAARDVRLDGANSTAQQLDEVWPAAIVEAARDLPPPSQPLEVLARCIRRTRYTVSGRSFVILGSPLFVASAVDD
jgi:hypothetical protein